MNVRHEAMASADNFQIHANQAEIDELIDASVFSTNSNNNSDQQNSLEVRESFQLIPSDGEESQTRSSLTGSDPEKEAKKSMGVTKKLRKMVKPLNVNESPKPQRIFKRATKKYNTSTSAKKSRSMFDFFSTYTQSNLDVDLESSRNQLNEAILMCPSQSGQFEFAVPQSVISLPDFQGPIDKHDKRVKNISTSVGSSLENNATPSNTRAIVPDLVDTLTAGSSHQENAPSQRTMENFLQGTGNTQLQIDNFLRKVRNCGLIIVHNSPLRHGSGKPLGSLYKHLNKSITLTI